MANDKFLITGLYLLVSSGLLLNEQRSLQGRSGVMENYCSTKTYPLLCLTGGYCSLNRASS